ncbi:MAG: fimbrillin family protein [Bacteroidales bacterium]|nr:fimbrillin family protein [Bacteroidales bacterium]
MRKLIVAISLSIIALGLCSCRRDATTPADVKEDLQERTVVFTAAGRDFTTKSTDSGFEDGDAIGIFAPDMDKYNVQALVSGSSLTPSSAIRWGKGQESNSEFYAYYPYNPEVSKPTYSFSIATDQTADDAFLSADLRTSHVSAAPLSTVAFVLGHRFSKITFAFSGLAGGETITGVAIKDLYTKALVDIGTGAPGGLEEKADISAHKRAETVFEAVVIPQTYLKTVVKTSAGRTLEYTTFTPFMLESGCAYRAELTVPASGEDTSVIGLTFSIVDWDDGGVISYGEPSEQEGL